MSEEPTTKIRGVYRLPTGKYAARIHKGKRIFLGSFQTEEEAVAAYQTAKQADDPDDIIINRQRNRDKDFDDDDSPKPIRINTRGVKKQWNGKFMAIITIDGETESLGNFKTEEEAIAAYQIRKRKAIEDQRFFGRKKRRLEE